MRDNEHPIVVGRINGIYGVRGWVKVMSYTRPKENILSYSHCLVYLNGAWQELNIEESQQRGERMLVKFSGIDSPEQARDYLHSDLAVVRAQLPPLENDKYYWFDLIGLEIINQDSLSLGWIKEIVETGANDVLVIEGKGKTRILIPLIMDIYVKQVDLSANTMRVDWQLEDDVST